MKFTGLGSFVFPLIAILGTNAIPTNATSGLDILDHTAKEFLKRATPAPPHFVVYADAYDPTTTGPPAVSAIQVRDSSLGFTLENLYSMVTGI